jgi:hypothetical protein
MPSSTLVTPAKAGVQFVYLIVSTDIRVTLWIPACAGMTDGTACTD